MEKDEGDLWLSAWIVQERVGIWLQRHAGRETTVTEVAREVFGRSDPTRSVLTQIGRAIASNGWRRIEQRTRKPRYRYERP